MVGDLSYPAKIQEFHICLQNKDSEKINETLKENINQYKGNPYTGNNLTDENLW
ncbi:hypothetical protein LEP1GSC195_3884 [Leptospira wolbachii serovar Codice str. CDC]|uniref:Uncharacterized protein n=1 Tax=Leptospira wolbachii serovar Codice str. CDC TaxID=1218599 RepID=R9A4T6_9LEPT|nr:hypothetical protein LEP1GSC195_3884 [Leptospira wolbachii serovar Codice str. CDC]